MSLTNFSVNLGSSGVGDLNATPQTSISLFDDFITGNPGGLNLPYGPMGLLGVSIGGAAISALSNITQPVSGRIGIWAVDTGTTNNATGQALLYSDAASLWVGGGLTATYYCTAMLPILSTASNEFQVELGFRTTFTGTAGAGNSIAFLYNRQTSLNWQAITSNNGTVTTVTGSSTFAIVAGTWYNFKIVINASSVDFYIAPAGGVAYVLLGSSSTNLPDASNTTYLCQNIYRTATFALRRQCYIDMVRLDVNFNSSR